MSRDWQKDMEIIKAYLEFRHLSDYPEQKLGGEPVVNVLDYWLQHYAAEKARADQAELLIDNLGGGDRYKYIRHVRKKLEDEITLLVEHITEIEGREQKLREVIEEAMEEEWRLAGEQTPVYIILCQSLDPKEETKP